MFTTLYAVRVINYSMRELAFAEGKVAIWLIVGLRLSVVGGDKMVHPCKLCLQDSPEKYHSCNDACYSYMLYLGSISHERVSNVARDSANKIADVIRHEDWELD